MIAGKRSSMFGSPGFQSPLPGPKMRVPILECRALEMHTLRRRTCTHVSAMRGAPRARAAASAVSATARRFARHAAASSTRSGPSSRWSCTVSKCAAAPCALS